MPMLLVYQFFSRRFSTAIAIFLLFINILRVVNQPIFFGKKPFKSKLETFFPKVFEI